MPVRWIRFKKNSADTAEGLAKPRRGELLASFGLLVTAVLVAALATTSVVQTYMLQEREQERALQAGAVAFLQKPFGNDELIAAIQEALGESSKGTLPPN